MRLRQERIEHTGGRERQPAQVHRDAHVTGGSQVVQQLRQALSRAVHALSVREPVGQGAQQRLDERGAGDIVDVTGPPGPFACGAHVRRGERDRVGPHRQLLVLIRNPLV